MRRLNRHIVTEIIEVFFAVVIALILIMVSFQFAKLLSQAAAGKIVGSAVYKLVALQVVNLFVLLTPFAFFIAMLIALSRLAGDNELIAMRALGYSPIKLQQTLILLALPLAIFIAVMSLAVLPKILSLNYELLRKAQKESELSIIQPGQFRTIGGKTTVFVADVKDKTFSRFFVWQDNAGNQSVTVAQHGEQLESDGQRLIALTGGSRYNEKKRQQTSQLFSFERLLAVLPTVQPTGYREKLKAVDTKVLLSAPTLSHRIEFQRRLAPAISIILLAVCAPLLVQFNPRENRYGKFVIAILIYAIYANSQAIFQALIEKGNLPILPGVYTAHLVFLAVIVFWAWGQWWQNNTFKRSRGHDAQTAG